MLDSEWRKSVVPSLWQKLLLFMLKDARLAQSVEHETLNLRVVGSSPTLGAYYLVNVVNPGDKIRNIGRPPARL